MRELASHAWLPRDGRLSEPKSNVSPGSSLPLPGVPRPRGAPPNSICPLQGASLRTDTTRKVSVVCLSVSHTSVRQQAPVPLLLQREQSGRGAAGNFPNPPGAHKSRHLLSRSGQFSRPRDGRTPVRPRVLTPCAGDRPRPSRCGRSRTALQSRLSPTSTHAH